MTRIRISLVPVLLASFAAGARADAPAVIFDMDTVQHHPGQFTDAQQHKVPAGTAELAEGKFGKAVKFTFVAGASAGFMTARSHATPEWDRSDGFSFWVKGDGSRSFGGIELIDKDDFSRRYGYCFPIESTQWQKITVPWRDVLPELAAPLLDPAHPKTGYLPSHLDNFWFGKWFYWHDFPAHSYTVDQVALEPTLPPPAEIAPTPVAALRDKLARHRPVTIVTMGDSLTDPRHWSNRTTLWAQLVAKQIKAKYGSEVTLVDPAIGGTTLSQNAILMPRWQAEAPSPDLVLVWFGGNDWASGVRGPTFAEYLRVTVDRIRRQSGGSAAIVLMTTCPTHDSWEAMRELEEAARKVAAEKKTALADAAGEFRKAGTPDEAMKREYWGWDKVHLGPKGHELVKDLVMKTIEDAP